MDVAAPKQRPVQLSIPIDDRSRIGQARRDGARLCADAGLDEDAAGRIAIIITELATNVLLHGGGGELLLQRLVDRNRVMVEVLAVDRGPGMGDVDRCMADGFSSFGTAGNGLGAVRRIADLFDVFSSQGSGTIVVARVCSGVVAGGIQIGAVSVPHPAETECGDGWQWHHDDRGASFLVVDGLGHGPQAAAASDRALGAFESAPGSPPASILTAAHERMASTRGGAVAVARIDAAGTLRYGAIGNIAGALATGTQSRGLFSHNGTVGAQIRSLRELEYPCPSGTLLIMHSDGLSTRWRLDSYPGLVHRHPAVVAAVLYRDFRRERDDATVLAVRIPDRWEQ